MLIFYLNVIEQHSGWGAEWFVNQAFIANGHNTITLDYRERRGRLASHFATCGEFDALLLQRGEWFPLSLLKAVNRPRFYWATELVERCNDQNRLFSSNLFDHVFVRGTACRNALIDKGWLAMDRVSVLLSGYDETFHKKLKDQVKDIDVVFVGNISNRRRYILNKLHRHFKVYEAQVFGDEMIRLFNRARIVINIHADEYLDTETRIYEALGCGAFLLTEKLALESPFIPGQHLVEAGTTREMAEMIDHYLSHEQEREQIAQQGHDEVLAKHTYTMRAKQLVDTMQHYLPFNRNGPSIRKGRVKAYGLVERLYKLRAMVASKRLRQLTSF